MKIPVILRETDYSKGLANKLCIPFAKQLYIITVCGVSFFCHR